MNYRLGTLGLIAAMVLSQPSYAQDEEPAEPEVAAADGAKALLGRKLYLSPMFNYLRAANARGTKDGFGGQIALGKSVTNGLNLELVSQYLVADSKSGGGSAKLAGVGIGAMVFPVNSLPDLYVPISIMRGQVNSNPGPIPDYSTTFFDVGLGYLIGLGSQGAALRAEVRYRVDAHGRELAGVHTGERKAFYEGIAGIGVLIPIGGGAVVEPPPAEVAPTEVVPVVSADADNDGVPDDQDQCPDTPAGTVVDATGCPVVAEPAPLDNCTPPAAGDAVDLNGCKVAEPIVLRGVNFELDSARLTPNAKVLLDGVSDAMLAQPGIKVEIGGYTSSEGSDAHNQGLSERRAASVMEYLVGRGVTADRLTNKGYGEASPVADNSTEDGRELNRRVELKVTDTGVAAAAPEAAPAEAAPEAAPAEGEAAAAPAEETPAEAAPAEASADESAPAEAKSASTEGEAAPAEGEAAAPVEGETVAPAEGEAAAPAEGETATPAEGEAAAPAEGEAAPAETPADSGTAPEVENAQPAQ